MSGREGQFFVGIGGMRCATTWVANILDLHPQIYFSPIKELHYFNYKYRDEIYGRGKAFKRFYREQYGNIFKKIKTRRSNPKLAQAFEKRNAVRSDHDYKKYFEAGRNYRAFGEITPGYDLLPEKGFRDIRNLFLDSKVIFGMRDPADRMWSQWHKIQKRKSGREDTEFSNTDHKNFVRFMNNASIFERARYDKTLERLYNVFEPKNVFTYFYEDLFFNDDSTANFITDLYKFLGTDPHKIPDEKYRKKWDPTSVGELPADLRQKVMAEYRPMIERIQVLEGRVPERWLS